MYELQTFSNEELKSEREKSFTETVFKQESLYGK